MRGSSLLLALASAIPSALSQSVFSCERDDPKLPSTSYTMKESMDFNLATLRKHFVDKKKLASIPGVLDSSNHQMHNLDPQEFANAQGLRGVPETVWQWETANDGFDDFGTEKWKPQGLTSSSDALEAGEWKGRNVWIVSWYSPAEHYGSVRVTVIDKETRKYRHVLLVEPNEEGPVQPATDFKPIDIHAGGIVWYGNTLWVADTTKGLRVFDLDNIWEVEIGDKVGKNDNGEFTAQNYRYVIPQVAKYTFNQPDEKKLKVRFSFVSIDRTDTPDTLMIGEFRAFDTPDDWPIRFVKWDLDYKIRRLKTNPDTDVATASWAYCVNINDMQGAISVGEDFYINTSNYGEGIGDMWLWSPGEHATELEKFLPPGPEDLSWDHVTRTWATVTEYTERRWLVTYDPPT